MIVLLQSHNILFILLKAINIIISWFDLIVFFKVTYFKLQLYN